MSRNLSGQGGGESLRACLGVPREGRGEARRVRVGEERGVKERESPQRSCCSEPGPAGLVPWRRALQLLLQRSMLFEPTVKRRLAGASSGSSHQRCCCPEVEEVERTSRGSAD